MPDAPYLTRTVPPLANGRRSRLAVLSSGQTGNGRTASREKTGRPFGRLFPFRSTIPGVSYHGGFRNQSIVVRVLLRRVSSGRSERSTGGAIVRIENPPRYSLANVRTLERLAENGADGRNWYHEAEREIERVCRRETWRPETVAGFLAVLSPRCAVKRNVRNAFFALETGRPFDSTIRAVKTAFSTYVENGTLNGQKISAFYEALTGNENAVTLDVHMANALHIPQRAFQREAVRERCRSVVSRLADRLRVTPREAQAMVWYGQLRSIGRLPERYPIEREYYNFRAQGRTFPETGVIPQLAYRGRNGRFYTQRLLC